MKSAQLTAHGTPGQFRIADLPELNPGQGEVVVRVRACGLNHLDLWLEEGKLPIPIHLPRTPGSEISGEILKTSIEITGWKPGERVAIQSNLFCGKCEYCLKEEESMCLEGKLLGVEHDGGFAEQVVVPSRLLVKLPDNVSFETSASLTLAGSTAMRMLTDRVQVHPGAWVLVIGGASGVGSAAIQIARGLGARVIATASSDAKKNLAFKLGAEQVVDSGNDAWPSEVRKITAKRGVDFVIEHVGGKVLQQVFTCLARDGAVITCGATAGREVDLNLWPFFVKQQRLIGSYGRTRKDLMTTLDWMSKGSLLPVIDRVVNLAETPNAFAALRNRQVLGKIIVVPQP